MEENKFYDINKLPKEPVTVIRKTLLQQRKELLERIQQLEKENEELKNITRVYNSYMLDSSCDTRIIIANSKYFADGYFVENYIPKYVIREKIEEYREERNKLANGEFWDEPKTHQDDYIYFIACEVLKELLGEEK